MNEDRIIESWKEQKALDIASAQTSYDETLDELISTFGIEETEEYKYAWITPAKYELEKVFAWGAPANLHSAHFYLDYNQKYKSGGIWFFDTFEELTTFKTKEAAIKAFDTVQKYLKHEISVFKTSFCLKSDAGINGLLASKHLEIMKELKLYRIKITNIRKIKFFKEE